MALPLQSGPPGKAPTRAVPCAPECAWIGDKLSFLRMRRLRDGAIAPGPPLIYLCLDVTLALLGARTALAQLSMSLRRKLYVASLVALAAAALEVECRRIATIREARPGHSAP